MATFSELLMYLPGAVVFLVGSGQTRSWFRQLRGTDKADGVVTSCEHVVKKDKKDRDVYNYYDVAVTYKDPETGKNEKQTFKSPTEYSLKQPVKVYKGSDGKAVITEKVDEEIFHPLAMMVLGALLILLALWQNQGKEVWAMGALAASLMLAGAVLIGNYIKLKRMHMETIEAEIIGTYTRQLSKSSKILKSDRFTYYPIVRYEVNGTVNTRRCLVNSSNEKAFKKGDAMKLYYEKETGAVREKNANPLVLAGGILFFLTGAVAGLSILSVTMVK
ncbi:MAG: hypothetical protein IKP86_08225 [Anaerolineaceae bacterium]|nr:hypothetical protein [Anaerolineaceae bacterium]